MAYMMFVVKEIDNEPHGILQISSYVKKHGHETGMVVATDRDPLEAVLEARPDVVAYTLYSGSQKYYLELNRRIKEHLPGVFSAFGGPHPTYYPQIIEEPGVDGVCRGEGEEATLELLDTLDAGKLHSRLDMPNWSFKVNGEIIRNPVRPLVEDLDSLPFADRELLYDAHPASREQKIKPFIAGRGCPYNCSFCFNHAFYKLYGIGRKVRYRSPANVIEEIKQVRDRHPLEFLLFMDDTFIINLRWLREFAEMYRREVGLPFWCQVRADLVAKRPETARILKEMGCWSVSFGIEAGDERLRNAILKRNMDDETIVATARILREAGIRFMTNNMLGLPTGTLEDDFTTLELNARCRPSYANVFLFQPYPGTELGEWAYREGWTTGSFDMLDGSHTEGTIVKFGTESEKRQIENLQKLFAVTVEFPWLLPVVRQLIKLPRNWFYWLVYKLWKGYTIKVRMFPYRQSVGELLKAAWQYMKIRTQ